MKKLIAGMTVAAVAVAGTAFGATGVVRTRSTSADPNGGLTFTKKRLTVRHGYVKLVMKNPTTSGLPHAIAIGKHKGKWANPGHNSHITVKLAKGTYTFYCPVPGHRAAGMKGKLVVD